MWSAKCARCTHHVWDWPEFVLVQRQDMKHMPCIGSLSCFNNLFCKCKCDLMKNGIHHLLTVANCVELGLPTTWPKINFAQNLSLVPLWNSDLANCMEDWKICQVSTVIMFLFFVRLTLLTFAHQTNLRTVKFPATYLYEPGQCR